MLSKAERLLGRVALERGVIGPDALARAIEAKERAGASAPELTEILVQQGAITREQQRAIADAARDAGRRRAAVKWAVERAGKNFEGPAEGDLPFVVEQEGAWAGPGLVEIPPPGSIPPPGHRGAGHGGAAGSVGLPGHGGPPGAAPHGPAGPPPQRAAALRSSGPVAVAPPPVPPAAPPATGPRALPQDEIATPAGGQLAVPELSGREPPGSGSEKGAPANAGVEVDLAIAKVAMERGLITLAEVREALQAQADFAAIGRPLPLGQVLIKRRSIDVDTFVDLTREARARSVRCESCGVLSLLPRAIAAAQANVEGRCPRCSAALPILRAGAASAPTPAPVAVPPRRTDRGVPYRPRPPVEPARLPLTPTPNPATRDPGIPPTRGTPAAPPSRGSMPVLSAGSGGPGVEGPSPVPPPAELGAPSRGASPGRAEPLASSTEGDLAAPDEIPLPDLDLDGTPPPPSSGTPSSGGAPALLPASDPYGIKEGAFDERPSDDLDFSGIRREIASRGAAAAAQPPPPPAADLISAAPAPPPAAKPAGPKKPKGESLAGQAFGRYEILAEIARGGMGVVYRAKEKDGRVVALKVLKDGIAASDKQVRRFKRETEAVAKLKHPSIVPIYDVGCETGRHYFTMEYIDGLPADELIRRGPVDVPKALAIAEEVARAIHHAHERGVIHRDIKPANILLDRNGGPHITDFGLAKNVDRVSAMTKTGAAVGTPFYMPPEQAKGDAKQIDHRVDVYAIGVVLYEMLTSELPFDGETTLEVYHKILQDEVPVPSRLNAAVDAEVDTIVGKCMAKEKGERYESALALAEDIRRKLDGNQIRAKPPGAISVAAQRVRRIGASAAVIGAALTLSFLVAGGVLLVMRQRDQERLAVEVASDLTDWGRKIEVRLEAARNARAKAQALVGQPGHAAEALERIDEGLRQLEKPEAWLDDRTLRFKENAAKAKERLEQARAKEIPPLAADLAMLRARALASRAGPGDRAAWEAVLAALDRAISLDGARLDAHLDRGRALLALGRLEDAEAALSRPAEAKGQKPEIASEALLLRGDIRVRLGQNEAAERDWKDLEGIERAAEAILGHKGPSMYSNENLEPTRLGTAMIRRALATAAAGHVEDGRAILSDLIRDEPAFFAAWVALSDLEREGGTLEAALRAANQAIDGCRDWAKKRPEGYVARGRALLEQGRVADAERAFADAIERDRDGRSAAARVMHAVTLEWLLDFDGAAKDLAAARAAPPGENDGWRALAALRAGEALRAAGETARGGKEPALPPGFTGAAPGPYAGPLDPVIACYDEAIALDPRLFAAYLARGRLKVRAGDGEGARRDLAIAATLPGARLPSGGAALENAEGLLALARGDAKRAADRFAAARGLLPDGIYPEAAANEAHALAKQGDAAGARPLFERALALEASLGAEGDAGLTPAAQAMVRLAAGREMCVRPDAEAAVHFRAGVAARALTGTQQTMHTRAVAALQRAAGLSPSMARAWMGLAQARGEEQRALDRDAVERAVRANPCYPEALAGRGKARLDDAAAAGAGTAAQRTAAASALSDFDAALALSLGGDASLEARLGRTRALLIVGEVARAAEEAERVLDGAVRRTGPEAQTFLASAYALRAEVRKAEGKEDLAKMDRVRAQEIRAARTVEAKEKCDEGLRLLNAKPPRADESIPFFSQAIELDRRYAEAWYGRAAAQFRLLNSCEAALDGARALELDPHYADQIFDLASEQSALNLDSFYADVSKEIQKAPDNLSALFIRGLYGCVRTYLGQSDGPERDAALAALDRALVLQPQHVFAYVCRGYLRQNRGDLDGALADIKRAQALDDRSVLSAFLEAVVRAKKDQRAQALEALERAAERNFKNADRLRSEPAFAPLATDPRWAAVLERVEANAVRAANRGQ